MKKLSFITLLVCLLPILTSTAQSVVERFSIRGPQIDYINKPYFGFRVAYSVDATEYALTPISFAFVKSNVDNAFRCSQNAVFIIPAVITYTVLQVRPLSSNLRLYMLLTAPQLLPNLKLQRNIFKNTVFVTIGQNTDYYFTHGFRVYSESILGLKVRHAIGSLELFGALPWTTTYFANRNPYCSLSAHIALFRSH